MVMGKMKGEGGKRGPGMGGVDWVMGRKTEGGEWREGAREGKEKGPLWKQKAV